MFLGMGYRRKENVKDGVWRKQKGGGGTKREETKFFWGCWSRMIVHVWSLGTKENIEAESWNPRDHLFKPLNQSCKSDSKSDNNTNDNLCIQSNSPISISISISRFTSWSQSSICTCCAWRSLIIVGRRAGISWRIWIGISVWLNGRLLSTIWLDWKEWRSVEYLWIWEKRRRWRRKRLERFQDSTLYA